MERSTRKVVSAILILAVTIGMAIFYIVYRQDGLKDSLLNYVDVTDELTFRKEIAQMSTCRTVQTALYEKTNDPSHLDRLSNIEATLQTFLFVHECREIAHRHEEWYCVQELGQRGLADKKYLMGYEEIAKKCSVTSPLKCNITDYNKQFIEPIVINTIRQIISSVGDETEDLLHYYATNCSF